MRRNTQKTKRSIYPLVCHFFIEDICGRKAIDMNTDNINIRRDNIPDTISALMLMQKSLMSELNRKQCDLSLNGSEVGHLRNQNKMLEQQIACMISMVRNFESPMN